MKTIGERIIQFDNSADSTLKTFNEIFTKCPITGFHDGAEVIIGEPHTATTTRIVTVDGLDIIHEFNPRSTLDAWVDETDKEMTW